MGRTAVRRVGQPRSHRVRDWLLLVVAAAILIFAAVGVVSAAGYVGGKVAASPGRTRPPRARTTSNAIALQDVARAQAQATAIIKAAHTAGKAIVNSETRKAHRQASTIIAGANAQAKSHIAAVAPVPTSAPATSAQATAPSVPPSNSISSGGAATAPGGAPGSTGTSGYSATSSGTSTGSSGGPSSSATGAPGASGTTPPASTPNLGAVPPTWLVVAYNATFGAGPGNAGSIAVVNRSKFAFSGVARVNYIGSGGIMGSAYAPFSGLAPGQSETLPLNGMTYPAGATRYQIEVTNVH